MRDILPLVASKEVLHKKYIEEDKSQKKVAQELGCNPNRIIQALKAYDIPSHPPGYFRIKNALPQLHLNQLWKNCILKRANLQKQ